LSLKAETTLIEGLKVDLETSFNPHSASKEVKLGFGFKNEFVNTNTKTNIINKPTLTTDVTFG